MKPYLGRGEPRADRVAEAVEWQPRRRHGRFRMFAPAHVVVGEAVLDCVLVDMSPDGAQVCLATWADLPEHVTLLLSNVGSRPMRRCWQQGSFCGFEAVGEATRLA